jgi:hypothetical protein
MAIGFGTATSAIGFGTATSGRDGKPDGGP